MVMLGVSIGLLFLLFLLFCFGVCLFFQIKHQAGCCEIFSDLRL